MDVALIVPTLNAENTIDILCESIINQTIASEVLFIDGGSKDNTLQKIKRYGFKYIQTPSTIFEAQNMGINSTDSTYLYFIGADDYLYDSKVINNISNLDFELLQGKIAFTTDSIFSYTQRQQNYVFHRKLFKDKLFDEREEIVFIKELGIQPKRVELKLCYVAPGGISYKRIFNNGAS